MKKNYHYEEIINIEDAMTRIMKYNAVMRFPMNEDFYRSELFNEYVTTDDPKRLKDLEDIIGAAAEKAINDDPDILRKEKNKHLMKTQLVDVFRAGRVECKYINGDYGDNGHKAEKTYKEELLKINIVRKSNTIEYAKKTLKKIPVKVLRSKLAGTVTGAILGAMMKGGSVGVAIAGGSVTIAGITIGAPALIGAAVGGILAFGINTLIHHIPQENKKKIKENVRENVERTCNYIKRQAEPIKNTETYQTYVEPVVEKVKPFYEKAKDWAEEKWESVKKLGTKLWKRVKSAI